jgi:protoheme IX farnesyltransferase
VTADFADDSGPWLRLTALAGAGATGLVVAAAALHLDVAHRVLAAAALPPLVAVAVAAVVAHHRLRPAALAALGLFMAEIVAGGVAAVTGRPSWAVVLHVAFAAAALAAALIAAAATFRDRSPGRVVWRDYVTLTKPRIMSLLLLTAACGMVVGDGGLPGAGRFAATMVGLALACGGASAFNHLLDRDIDRTMSRTDRRPVASGRVSPPRALEFGLALSAASFVLLGVTVNLVAALLALVGNLFYVFVYTRWLKRSTPQNIVIGGAAGAIPPLVGWAAATGRITLPALVLFLIVFVWTPPHFWALALLIKREYQAAGVPMLPVVRGGGAGPPPSQRDTGALDVEATRQIVRYSVAMVAVTLLPAAVGIAGWGYVAAAALLGAYFLYLARRLRRDPGPGRAGALFHYSLLYLALLFVAMALDAALTTPIT